MPLLLFLSVLFADPTPERPKAGPKNEAVAEVQVSWSTRLPTLWKKNKGVGLPAGLPWKERVTLRPWSDKGKRFDDLIENVDARRVQHDGATAFVLRGEHVTGGRPPRDSEIIDTDGVVWILGTAVDNGPDYACYVRQK